MFKKILLLIGVSISALSLAMSAFAQATDAELETKGRKIDEAVGNAFVCMEDSRRTDMKEEIRILYNSILQETGSDLGFVFASSVGYGSAQQESKLECSKMLGQWQEMRQDYELVEE